MFVKCIITIKNCSVHNLDITNCKCHTEVYDLPKLKGLRLVKGLCYGVQLGVKAMAGFPSLQTLKHTANLSQHGVNVFNSESKYVLDSKILDFVFDFIYIRLVLIELIVYRNETMVITVINQFEDMSTEDIAREKIGNRIFVGMLL